MKSSTRIDSVVFQLTPTRTRCDLVINANGKTQRIFSGLLNPFLTHLKSAQEQIGKGGYSIILELHRGSDSEWFTKGTVERFVRFVSTPEILERVYTIESEISQIQEAISFQSNNDTYLHSQVQDHKKYKESGEAASRKQNSCIDSVKPGGKAQTSGNEEKAIVLYKPDTPAPQTDQSNMQGENSKIQLLKVLETRKSVLQKEQGMAFARAVAAGFDLDHIAPLMSFAECFGATRMMEACVRFVELWKAKHESGQWVEIETAEALSRADFASTNAFTTPNANDKQKGFKELWLQGDVPLENNGTSNTGSNAGLKAQMDNHGPSHTQEHLLGQFPHQPMHPPWPVHPQASQMPLFQPYPMPMPYYQNYPGNGTFFHPLYPSADDSGRIVKQRKHSMDNGDMCTDSEIQDIDASKSAIYHSSDIDEDSENREVRKKGRKAARKQSGTVVIRNINYIASKKQTSSDSDSQSSSASEDGDDDGKTMKASTYGVKNENLRRRSKREGNQRSDDTFKQFDKEDNLSGNAGDGHWQAFQNFLLRDADEDDNSGKSSMFVMEGKVPGRKRQAALGDDPLILGRQQKDGELDNHHDISRDMIRTVKPSLDRMLTRGGVNLAQSTDHADGHLDIRFAEMGGRSIAYRQTAAPSDELMIHGHDKLSVIPASAADSYVVDQFGYTNAYNRSSPHDLADESFIVPRRSSSIDQVGGHGRMTIDMDSELPMTLAGSENIASKIEGESNYEPYELNMMPDRVTENGMANHDPALDYELQAARVNGDKKSADGKQGTKKGDNVQGLKSQKKVTSVTKRGKPSKLSPLEEARARAEKLRSFKADLQKLKKDKEEEQIKRLEALKIERQKRIAARSSSGALARTSLPSPPAKKLQTTKLSPASHKGSKFSDTEPGSSSPLQRSTVKMISRLSGDAHKTAKPGKLNFSSPSGGNRLTRSASSLNERKEENNGSTPDSKASMARIRRLSEPKSSNHLASSVKAPSERSLSRRTSKGAEMKKTPAAAKSEVTKAVARPESNTKELKGISEVVQKKSSIKEPTRKMKMGSIGNASAGMIGGNDGVSYKNDYDESTAVEKTVVTVECKKPSPVIQASEEKMHIQSQCKKPCPVVQASEEKVHIQTLKSASDSTEKRNFKGVAVHQQISPSNVKEINGGTVKCEIMKASPSNEAGAANHADKVLPDISTVNITEKPYNAPYARVSFLEDPCMEKSEYAKAPPTSDMTAAGSELKTAHVSSGMTMPESYIGQHKLDKMWEVSEKPFEKESSKGLKRLLKFGRKKHSSTAGESSLDLDVASNEGSIVHDNSSHFASSGEVTTLKNLISQGEGSSAHTTPQKSSRSFSLLSPFRIKTTEKKLNM